MKYCSEERNRSYFPPLLGNGDMSFAVDCEGTLAYRATDFPAIKAAFSGGIFRAGRRLPVTHDKIPARLLSFGKFVFDVGSPLVGFTQELIPDCGLVRSVCVYETGMEVISESLIHPEMNLYLLRKKFTHLTVPVRVQYTYSLCGYDSDTEAAIVSKECAVSDVGCRFSFGMCGMDFYRGGVIVRLDRSADVSVCGNTVTLSTEVREGDEFSFALLLADDMGNTDADAELTAMEEKFTICGADGLLAETAASFAAYFDASYVRTEDEKLNSVYRTALYHLRCYTTKWSIPIGLNPAAWDGKFFAFDEYYSMLGLLGANHPELAGRVPAFRKNVCLEKAIRRVSFAGAEDAAQFFWETGEYGEELASPGRWFDHIFHMAVVALGAFEFYEFTGDRKNLETYYPLIRACAKFYTRYAIYSANDKVYVGKCCDLERLGGGIFNPFMTSCGVIRTLEICARASEILGVDSDYRAECLALAKGLRETLPQNDRRYLPYVGCPVDSIAMFAGKFPFDVLKSDDPKMHAAWSDFLGKQNVYGNMYAMGKGISPWYACWEAEGFARSGMAEEAKVSLARSYHSVGVFDEMFEINEEIVCRVPWFTTAAGVFLSSVNEMLLWSDGEKIDICHAYPLKDASISFRLAAKGGAVVTARISDGKPENVDVALTRPGQERTFRIYFRGEYLYTVTVKS